MNPTLEEEVKEHKDESDSSKSDCHWKRPLKKAKVSGEDLEGMSSRLIELASDESLTGPHAIDSAFKEVGTSKTPVTKPVEQSLCPSALLEEIR
ncbi:hypothetical protein E5676_scaffold519G00320 [Cucumis melo var. makuwa]|uniref:Uncharacterized protein n=1 Tax=Cucumis melo var. makuwa TaxID=1194695 RepID=A0A5A7UJZ0_CUCMM|nr:hypothetical protein E6C27_scaffold24G003300 [Cucumis melo var. makuwa]TYK20405.1 hypothetical protein E5676_scaffold519G00320 [Cucumis melo var. makuwa]